MKIALRVIRSCDFRCRDPHTVLTGQKTAPQEEDKLLLVYAGLFVEYLFRLRYPVTVTTSEKCVSYLTTTSAVQMLAIIFTSQLQ